jgi:hypothetical protein
MRLSHASFASLLSIVFASFSSTLEQYGFPEDPAVLDVESDLDGSAGLFLVPGERISFSIKLSRI